ncbi:MAG: glycosyltransferase [Renibacterium sp.]|nr:glycosyltransferase [Renibacterium sp.]
MKIIHVISLLDPELSFGGPTRVALTQLKALQEAGHEVLLVAGVQGFDPRALAEYDGVPVKAFRAHRIPGIGFAGLFSPGMLGWLLRARLAADIIHIHLARDLVSAPAAGLVKLRKMPFVAQTHGMIDESARRLARLLDAVLIRRLLRSARTLFALTEKEETDLLAVQPGLQNIQILPNGMDPSAFSVDLDAEPIEVLFLARLQERKRPLEFIHAARRLSKDFPDAVFTLAGPDGGQLQAVQAALADDDGQGRIRFAGSIPPEDVRRRMSMSNVYVLPSLNEPFPMTVLEAMSTGVSVVTMEDCGLAPLVEKAGGEVAGFGVGELVEGIRRLLADAGRRKAFAGAAPALLAEEFGIDRVVGQLVASYRYGKQSGFAK